MAHFITEACIGCTICAMNCPVLAIEGVKKERHTVNPLRCVDCGVCGRSCPSHAIQDAYGDTAHKVPRAEWSKPTFDEDGCSACSICIDICSWDCIALTRPKAKGDTRVHAYLSDEKHCVGCALCANACPLKVIEMVQGG